MTNTHTPGPWTYFVGNANGRGLIRIETPCYHPQEAGTHIASMVRGPVSEANARLIAAAPDLLAASRAALAALQALRDAPQGGAEVMLRAAIAKTEGRA